MKGLSLLMISLVLSAFIDVAPGLAWQTSQSASSKCEGQTAYINWKFTNSEPLRTIQLVVGDNQTGKSSGLKTVTPGQTVSGRFKGGKKLTSGTVDFSMRFENNENEEEIKHDDYPVRNCSDASATVKTEEDKPPQDNLPNTGPLGIGLYIGLALAAGAAWLTTNKELLDAVRSR